MQSIDTTISLNKLALIMRRKCTRRGNELTAMETKSTSNNADRRRDGNAATLPAMDGTAAAAMDGRQRGGDNGDGQHGGDDNGWCNGKVVAMMVMDGATVTAIARQRCATTATEGATVTQRQ